MHFPAQMKALPVRHSYVPKWCKLALHGFHDLLCLYITCYCLGMSVQIRNLELFIIHLNTVVQK